MNVMLLHPKKSELLPSTLKGRYKNIKKITRNKLLFGSKDTFSRTVYSIVKLFFLNYPVKHSAFNIILFTLDILQREVIRRMDSRIVSGIGMGYGNQMPTIYLCIKYKVYVEDNCITAPTKGLYREAELLKFHYFMPYFI